MKPAEAMPDRFLDVIERRTGIKNGAPETLEEVAKVYGITRERVRQIEAQAIDVLRTRLLNVDDTLEFIIAWQTSASIKAAASTHGISYGAAYAKSRSLIEFGFNLKAFKHGRAGQVAKLSPEQRAGVDPKFAARQERTRKLIEMWNKGHRPEAISKELGWGNKFSVAAEVCRLRKSGHHLLSRGMLGQVQKSPEEFIRTWNSSSSIQEVCDRIGMKYPSVYARSRTMKKLGIQLKKFDKQRERYSPSYLESLKKLARETLGVTDEKA